VGQIVRVRDLHFALARRDLLQVELVGVQLDLRRVGVVVRAEHVLELQHDEEGHGQDLATFLGKGSGSGVLSAARATAFVSTGSSPPPPPPPPPSPTALSSTANASVGPPPPAGASSANESVESVESDPADFVALASPSSLSGRTTSESFGSMRRER